MSPELGGAVDEIFLKDAGEGYRFPHPPPISSPWLARLGPEGAALIFVNEMLPGYLQLPVSGFLCLHLFLSASFWPFLVLSLLPVHLPVAG